MATSRLPQVLVGGKTRQLPAGDSLPVTAGGTGATTALAARTNLGLGNIDDTPAVDKSVSDVTHAIHAGTIVKAFIYDTTRDSDGGAWRLKCQARGWFNEALGGTDWLGQAVDAATAWLHAKAGPGAYFQNTTDGKFYTLGAATPTVTECTRGSSKNFPVTACIIAEATRVVIYDLGLSSAPMWMVFKATTAGYLLSWNSASPSISDVAARDGVLVVGGSNPVVVNFLTDTYKSINTSLNTIGIGGIAARNTALGTTASVPGGYTSLSNAVKGVAITSLPNAPRDLVTGMPVLTFALGCTGGATITDQSGAYNHQTWGSYDANYVGFTSDYRFWRSSGTDNMLHVHRTGVPTVSSSEYTEYARFSSIVVLGGVQAALDPTFSKKAVMSAAGFISGGDLGVTRIRYDLVSAARSLFALTTKRWFSGWYPSGTLGAHMADSVTGAVTAGSLLSNGDFMFTTAGWTAINATLTSGFGTMKITQTAVGAGAYTTISCVVGQTYFVSVNLSSDTLSGDQTLNVGTTSTGADTGTISFATVGTPSTIQFVATQTTHYLSVQSNAGTNGQFYEISAASAAMVVADRVKGVPLFAVGATITRSAVASGAELVGYSGFSSSSYLTQPYNNAIQFGTGDLCIMGWAKLPASSAGGSVFHRALSGQTGGMNIYIYSGGGVAFNGSANTSMSLIKQTTNLIPMDKWVHICVTRVSGVVEIYIDGVPDGPVGNATDLTYANAVIQYGRRCDTYQPFPGSIALWRISGTALTANQVKFIHRTEAMLFEPNAKCLITGTTPAITALTYDQDTGLALVGTADSVDGFRDLTRVFSGPTGVGTCTALASMSGITVAGGTGSTVYFPAFRIRDELRRKADARAAFGSTPVFMDFTALASQTAFYVPPGFTMKALYKNGTLMREATTGVYWTRSTDGFQEVATLSVGATVSDWVSIMCVRN